MNILFLYLIGTSGARQPSAVFMFRHMLLLDPVILTTPVCCLTTLQVIRMTSVNHSYGQGKNSQENIVLKIQSNAVDLSLFHLLSCLLSV